MVSATLHVVQAVTLSAKSQSLTTRSPFLSALVSSMLWYWGPTHRCLVRNLGETPSCKSSKCSEEWLLGLGYKQIIPLRFGNKRYRGNIIVYSWHSVLFIGWLVQASLSNVATLTPLHDGLQSMESEPDKTIIHSISNDPCGQGTNPRCHPSLTNRAWPPTPDLWSVLTTGLMFWLGIGSEEVLTGLSQPCFWSHDGVIAKDLTDNVCGYLSWASAWRG